MGEGVREVVEGMFVCLLIGEISNMAVVCISICSLTHFQVGERRWKMIQGVIEISPIGITNSKVCEGWREVVERLVEVLA